MQNFWSVGGKADSSGWKKVSPKRCTKAGLGRKVSLSAKEYDESVKRFNKLIMKNNEPAAIKND